MIQATLRLQLAAFTVGLPSVRHSRPHAVAVSQDPVAIIHHARQPVMMLPILHQTQLEAMSAIASGPMHGMLHDELFDSQVSRRC